VSCGAKQKSKKYNSYAVQVDKECGWCHGLGKGNVAMVHECGSCHGLGKGNVAMVHECGWCHGLGKGNVAMVHATNDCTAACPPIWISSKRSALQ
jgi:DnaJ-class molecular chaperone